MVYLPDLVSMLLVTARPGKMWLADIRVTQQSDLISDPIHLK